MLRRVILALLVVASVAITVSLPVAAQGFGSDPNNYFCPEAYGDYDFKRQDGYKCWYGPEGSSSAQWVSRNAILKPPPLKIAQIWFVRFIYVLWGAAGVVFTFLLIGIGAQYMFSFGNEVAVAEVIKKFQKWIVGIALIFLSYPILATVFNLLPISQDQCYADVAMPGFQFFFPEACIRTCEDYCEPVLNNSGSQSGFTSCVVACQAAGGPP